MAAAMATTATPSPMKSRRSSVEILGSAMQSLLARPGGGDANDSDSDDDGTLSTARPVSEGAVTQREAVENGGVGPDPTAQQGSKSEPAPQMEGAGAMPSQWNSTGEQPTEKAHASDAHVEILTDKSSARPVLQTQLMSPLRRSSLLTPAGRVNPQDLARFGSRATSLADNAPPTSARHRRASTGSSIPAAVSFAALASPHIPKERLAVLQRAAASLVQTDGSAHSTGRDTSEPTDGVSHAATLTNAVNLNGGDDANAIRTAGSEPNEISANPRGAAPGPLVLGRVSAKSLSVAVPLFSPAAGRSANQRVMPATGFQQSAISISPSSAQQTSLRTTAADIAPVPESNSGLRSQEDAIPRSFIPPGTTRHPPEPASGRFRLSMPSTTRQIRDSLLFGTLEDVPTYEAGGDIAQRTAPEAATTSNVAAEEQAGDMSARSATESEGPGSARDPLQDSGASTDALHTHGPHRARPPPARRSSSGRALGGIAAVPTAAEGGTSATSASDASETHSDSARRGVRRSVSAGRSKLLQAAQHGAQPRIEHSDTTERAVLVPASSFAVSEVSATSSTGSLDLPGHAQSATRTSDAGIGLLASAAVALQHTPGDRPAVRDRLDTGGIHALLSFVSVDSTLSASTAPTPHVQAPVAAPQSGDVAHAGRSIAQTGAVMASSTTHAPSPPANAARVHDSDHAATGVTAGATSLGVATAGNRDASGERRPSVGRAAAEATGLDASDDDLSLNSSSSSLAARIAPGMESASSAMLTAYPSRVSMTMVPGPTPRASRSSDATAALRRMRRVSVEAASSADIRAAALHTGRRLSAAASMRIGSSARMTVPTAPSQDGISAEPSVQAVSPRRHSIATTSLRATALQPTKLSPRIEESLHEPDTARTDVVAENHVPTTNKDDAPPPIPILQSADTSSGVPPAEPSSVRDAVGRAPSGEALREASDMLPVGQVEESVPVAGGMTESPETVRVPLRSPHGEVFVFPSINTPSSPDAFAASVQAAHTASSATSPASAVVPPTPKSVQPATPDSVRDLRAAMRAAAAARHVPLLAVPESQPIASCEPIAQAPSPGKLEYQHAVDAVRADHSNQAADHHGDSESSDSQHETEPPLSSRTISPSPGVTIVLPTVPDAVVAAQASKDVQRAQWTVRAPPAEEARVAAPQRPASARPVRLIAHAPHRPLSARPAIDSTLATTAPPAVPALRTLSTQLQAMVMPRGIETAQQRLARMRDRIYRSNGGRDIASPYLDMLQPTVPAMAASVPAKQRASTAAPAPDSVRRAAPPAPLRTYSRTHAELGLLMENGTFFTPPHTSLDESIVGRTHRASTADRAAAAAPHTSPQPPPGPQRRRARGGQAPRRRVSQRPMPHAAAPMADGGMLQPLVLVRETLLPQDALRSCPAAGPVVHALVTMLRSSYPAAMDMFRFSSTSDGASVHGSHEDVGVFMQMLAPFHNSAAELVSSLYAVLPPADCVLLTVGVLHFLASLLSAAAVAALQAARWRECMLIEAVIVGVWGHGVVNALELAGAGTQDPGAAAALAADARALRSALAMYANVSGLQLAGNGRGIHDAHRETSSPCATAASEDRLVSRVCDAVRASLAAPEAAGAGTQIADAVRVIVAAAFNNAACARHAYSDVQGGVTLLHAGLELLDPSSAPAPSHAWTTAATVAKHPLDVSIPGPRTRVLRVAMVNLSRLYAETSARLVAAAESSVLQEEEDGDV